MRSLKNFFRNFVKQIGQKEPHSTLVKNIPEKGLILDAGSGEGRYASMLSSKGRTIICLDITRPKKRNPDNEYILGSIEYLPFKSDVFDFVYSVSVLQFLKNDEHGLFEFHRTLKAGRKLVLTVPTKYSIFHLIRELELFFNVYEYPEFNTPDHHYFSKKRMKYLSSKYFSGGKIKGMNFNFFPRFKEFRGNIFKKYQIIRISSRKVEEDLKNEYNIENFPKESPNNHYFWIFDVFSQFLIFFAWHYVVVCEKK
jgi:SAM-dependent methyltransferase